MYVDEERKVAGAARRSGRPCAVRSLHAVTQQARRSSPASSESYRYRLKSSPSQAVLMTVSHIEGGNSRRQMPTDAHSY